MPSQYYKYHRDSTKWLKKVASKRLQTCRSQNIACISGTMKTYWLEKREHRSSSTKGITIQEPTQWNTRNTEKRVSAGTPAAFTAATMYENQNCLDTLSRRGSNIVSPTPADSTFIPEERRIYSPITFQDVARRSVANSPTKNADSKGN